MKFIFNLFAILFSCIFAMQSLFAQNTQIYFNPAGSAYMNAISNWFSDKALTSQYTGSITDTTDLNFYSDNPFTIKLAAKNTLVCNDFNYNINTNETKNENFMILGDNTVFDIRGNLTLNLNGTGYYFASKMTLWANSQFNVYKDFIINGLGSSSVGVQFADPSSNSFINIYGNLILSSINGVDIYTSVGNFTVGKAVNLNGNLWDLSHLNSEGYDSVTRTIGGLGSAIKESNNNMQGTGRLQITKENAYVSLAFKNNVNNDFRGSFATSKKGQSLDIVMNSEDINAKQTLRFTSIGNYWSAGVELSNANIGDIYVENGTLELAMHSAMKASSVTLSQQNAKFSATGLDFGSTSGSINVDSMKWNAGALIVDINSKTNFDRIQINNDLTVDNFNQLSIELNLSANDLAVWLDSESLEYLDFKIVEFATTNALKENFVVITEEGVLAEIILNSNDLTLRLTAVPEPAFIGLFVSFGAFLLFLKSRRNR